MSIGRISTFLDIYIERDLKEGNSRRSWLRNWLTSCYKLRIVRFLRTPEYEKLFSGDPTWVTESIGGMALDGRTLVTKFRSGFCTLFSTWTCTEPNLTVLWSVIFPKL